MQPLCPSLAAGCRVGTYVVERCPANNFLASRRADTYNVGRILVECLLGVSVVTGATPQHCHLLTNPVWVPHITPAKMQEMLPQDHSSASAAAADHWEGKSFVLETAGKLLGVEFSFGVTGDRGKLAARRLDSLFSPAHQEEPIIKALTALMGIGHSLMTLSPMPGQVVSLLLRGVARDLDDAAAASGQPLRLKLADDLFPTCDEEYLALKAQVMPTLTCGYHEGLLRQLVNQQRQVLVGNHPLVPIPTPIKQQSTQHCQVEEQSKEQVQETALEASPQQRILIPVPVPAGEGKPVAHFILAPPQEPQPHLSSECTSCTGPVPEFDSSNLSSEVELTSSDESAAASQQQGPGQPLHRSHHSLLGTSPAGAADDDLDPQAFSHNVGGTLALLDEGEIPPLHQQQEQPLPSSQDANCSLLQKLAGLSPADKAVLMTLSGWEVFEDMYVFNPDGQLVQTVDEPLPLEIVAVIRQTLSEQGN
jgi:hypothetical protein